MTGPRRDTSARDAITYAADAGVRWAHIDRLAATDHAPAPSDFQITNRCENGEHSLCAPPWCECPCHNPGGWGER